MGARAKELTGKINGQKEREFTPRAAALGALKIVAIAFSASAAPRRCRVFRHHETAGQSRRPPLTRLRPPTTESVTELPASLKAPDRPLPDPLARHHLIVRPNTLHQYVLGGGQRSATARRGRDGFDLSGNAAHRQ